MILKKKGKTKEKQRKDQKGKSYHEGLINLSCGEDYKY